MVLGSAGGTAQAVVDKLRAEGVKAGLLKLRVFRPFPLEELAESLKNLKVLAVLDRSDSFGAVGGPVFNEVRSALFDLKKPPKVINYIYGLGGRDLGLEDIERVYQELQKIASNGQITKLVDYLTVRE